MKSFLKVWWLSLLFKLILSALIPLSADEAYYWVWSKNLQLSYFDHPPLVSWLFYLGHFLEPFENAVRWPSVLIGHATIAIWYYFLKDLFSWDQLKLWIYLVLFSPLLGLGSIIVTPDLPVVFFWSLSLVFALKALEKPRLLYYALLGLSLGLGFLSKYHIVIFVPCLVAYLSLEKKWNKVSTLGIITTVICGLIFSSPVLIWNYLNDFASFKFQLNHGLDSESYDTEWTISYVVGQILIGFPLVWLAAYKSKVSKDLRWLLYFTWIPFAFFLLTSFRALVEANWPIIGYPTLFLLAVLHPSMKSWAKYYAGFWGVGYLIVIGSLFLPTLRGLNEKISEPYEFQQLAQETAQLTPLYASSYQMASSLWYFSKKPVYKLKDISRFDFFDTLPEKYPTGALFYLVKRKANSLPQWISDEEWQVSILKDVSPDFEVLELKRR